MGEHVPVPTGVCPNVVSSVKVGRADQDDSAKGGAGDKLQTVHRNSGCSGYRQPGSLEQNRADALTSANPAGSFHGNREGGQMIP